MTDQKKEFTIEDFEKHAVIHCADGTTKPFTLTDLDREFFNAIEKAKKEGKILMLSKRRNRK